MTAGEDALREAARMETARVYGRLCPEQRYEAGVQVAEPAPVPVVDLAAARRRKRSA